MLFSTFSPFCPWQKNKCIPCTHICDYSITFKDYFNIFKAKILLNVNDRIFMTTAGYDLTQKNGATACAAAPLLSTICYIKQDENARDEVLDLLFVFWNIGHIKWILF